MNLSHTHTHARDCTLPFILNSFVSGCVAVALETGRLTAATMSICVSIHASSLPALLLAGLHLHTGTSITPALFSHPFYFFFPACTVSSHRVTFTFLPPLPQFSSHRLSCPQSWILSITVLLILLCPLLLFLRLHPPWQRRCFPHHCICCCSLFFNFSFFFSEFCKSSSAFGLSCRVWYVYSYSNTFTALPKNRQFA